MSNKEISNFLVFTGTKDENVARQYLEMSNNSLEVAVGLFMDHGGTVEEVGGSFEDMEELDRIGEVGGGDQDISARHSHEHELQVDGTLVNTDSFLDGTKDNSKTEVNWNSQRSFWSHLHEQISTAEDQTLARKLLDDDESAKMKRTNEGRAILAVQEIISLINNFRQTQMGYSVEAVAIDDMVFFTKNILDKQEEFMQSNISGYVGTFWFSSSNYVVSNFIK